MDQTRPLMRQSMSFSSPPPLRIRDLGYSPGQIPTGPKNSILDVPGVSVGQVTKVDGEKVRSGVTMILPRALADIHIPCYAGMHTLNGNGEVTGSYQIKDWGYINTPIALTNSTSLGTVYQGIWDHTLQLAKSQNKPLLQSGRDYGTPVVGETADWWLNDIYSSSLSASHVRNALGIVMNGGQASVLEGQNGGGAGMTCHEFLGGTGTSSRLVNGEPELGAGKDGAPPGDEDFVEGKYTVGVLCQSNYGHKKDLHIGGVPIGRLLLKEEEEEERANAEEDTAEKETKKRDEGERVTDGSIVIIIITDCPLMPHQLTRLAQRATLGLAQVGAHGIGRTHSGDIFIAISTANHVSSSVTSSTGASTSKTNDHSNSSDLDKDDKGMYAAATTNPLPSFEQYQNLRPSMRNRVVETHSLRVAKNECVDAIFRAASEAVEEAILNSVVANSGVIAAGHTTIAIATPTSIATATTGNSAVHTSKEGEGEGGGKRRGSSATTDTIRQEHRFGRKTTEGDFIRALPAERVRALLARYLVVV